MSIYNRYQKLQKYYLGVPVDPPEYQKGELIETGEWDSLYECEETGGGSELEKGCYFTYSFIPNNAGRYLIGFSYTEDFADDSMEIENHTDRLPFVIPDCKPFTYLTFGVMDITDELYNYIDISTLDTSKLLSFEYMFMGCANLEILNISNIKLKQQYVSFQQFAYKCGKMQEIIGIDTIDLTMARDLHESFYGCSSLKELKFNNTLTNINNIVGICEFCTSIETVELNINNTKNFINMTRAFYGCTNLKKCVIGTIKTNDMNAIFGECSSLEEIEIYGTINDTLIPSDAGVDDAFVGCEKLITIKTNENIKQLLINSADRSYLPEIFKNPDYEGWIINN